MIANRTTTYPPYALKVKNFKSVESKGVSITIGTTNPLNPFTSSSSSLSLGDTPATSGFRPTTIRSIFDLNFPPLSSSNDNFQKLHPITQIDNNKEPKCLNQNSPPPRNSYKFFKNRQNRASGCSKVESSPSLSSPSNSIMVLPPKRAIEDQDIEKSAKMRIFSPEISLPMVKYDHINGHQEPEPEVEFISTNGSIITEDNDQTPNGDKEGENHFDDDCEIVITIEDDDDKSDSNNGLDQSEPPKVDVSKADERCASNPVFPTESTQDSCLSGNESSNSGFTTFTTSNRNNRRKQDIKSRVCYDWNDKLSEDNSSMDGMVMAKTTIIDVDQKKSRSKSKTNRKNATAKTMGGVHENSDSAAQQNNVVWLKVVDDDEEEDKDKSAKKATPPIRKMNNSAGTNQRINNKSTTREKKTNGVRKSNRSNRAPCRTDARPQRNVHSVYSKVTLHEKKEKLQAQQKKRTQPKPARSSRNERSLLASNIIKKVPLSAQNPNSKQSEEPPTKSLSLPNGPSTTTTTTTTTENNPMTFPETARVVTRQPQGQNSSHPSSLSLSSSSSHGSDPGQSGSNPSSSTSQWISSSPVIFRVNGPENSNVLSNNLPSTIIPNHSQINDGHLNHSINNGVQSPEQISGPFVRMIRNGVPAEPAAGVFTLQYSPLQSPRSEIKRIEARETIQSFVLNKPEEVKPPPSVSNGNVGLTQCPNETVRECIQQCEQQQQQQQQSLMNTMTQRLRQVRQIMHEFKTEDEVNKWTCIFCNKRQHENQLGSLFGPYFVDFDSSGSLSEIWFHEDCYMWTMLPMVTPVKPLNPMAIDVIKKCRFNQCARCGLAGANIQCMARSCNTMCLHYICAREWDFFFDETSFTISCPDHYKNIRNGNGPPKSNPPLD